MIAPLKLALRAFAPCKLAPITLFVLCHEFEAAPLRLAQLRSAESRVTVLISVIVKFDLDRTVFDNGQGELSDAAAALDWIERENPDYSQCWVSGFSFGALICMQLIMRRPEVTKFVAISPQPNVYDFSFLAPCPISGLIVYGKNDELVQTDSILNLKKRLNMQKNIAVKFDSILNANHFYKGKEKELANSINGYIKDEVTVI